MCVAGRRRPSRSSHWTHVAFEIGVDSFAGAQSPPSIATSTFDDAAVRRPRDPGDRDGPAFTFAPSLRDVDARLGQDRRLPWPSRAGPRTRRTASSVVSSSSASHFVARHVAVQARARSAAPGSRARAAAARRSCRPRSSASRAASMTHSIGMPTVKPSTERPTSWVAPAWTPAMASTSRRDARPLARCRRGRRRPSFETQAIVTYCSMMRQRDQLVVGQRRPGGRPCP